jgi:hypothetical protein
MAKGMKKVTGHGVSGQPTADSELGGLQPSCPSIILLGGYNEVGELT